MDQNTTVKDRDLSWFKSHDQGRSINLWCACALPIFQ